MTIKTPTELQRFDDAFVAVLKLNPKVPPSPSRLNDEMWWTSGRMVFKDPMLWLRHNSINGRLSKRRIELLKQHGFVKNEKTGKWQKA